MNLITPQLKDAGLKELIELCPVDKLTIVNQCAMAEKLGVTTIEPITGIINQFARMGLCTAKNYCVGCDINVILNVEAHDMVCRGGFVAQEEVVKQELEKLVLEIKELKTKDVKQAERLSSIVSNIANFFRIAITSLSNI